MRRHVSFHFARSVALAFAIVTLGGLADASAQPSRPLRLVVLGDSLSAGFLLPEDAAFPAVLQQALRERGYAVSVANASFTNDTSWDGLARLDRDVPEGTDGVILELGANDWLRRTDPAVTRSVLDRIVGRLRERGIAVLLAGFRPPVSWGASPESLDAAYRAVAQRHRLAFHPDVYAGLWSDRRYTILDGVHPSPEGVRRMVAGVLPTATRFVAGLAGRPRGQAFPNSRGAAQRPPDTLRFAPEM